MDYGRQVHDQQRANDCYTEKKVHTNVDKGVIIELTV